MFREICVAEDRVNESKEVRVFLFPIAGLPYSARKTAYSVDYEIIYTGLDLVVYKDKILNHT